MKSAIRIAALLPVVAFSSVAAQGPGAPEGRDRFMPAAQMLLANTGPLELTDAQVVRLAAIARRTEARRRSMRAAMDSARERLGPGGRSMTDSVARRQFRDRMRVDMERARDQAQADQRDAIAVLSADQQARAWNIVANRGRMRPGGMRGGMRGGMGGGGGRGMRRGGMRPRQREFGPGPGAPGRAMPRPPGSPEAPIE